MPHRSLLFHPFTSCGATPTSNLLDWKSLWGWLVTRHKVHDDFHDLKTRQAHGLEPTRHPREQLNLPNLQQGVVRSDIQVFSIPGWHKTLSMHRLNRY